MDGVRIIIRKITDYPAIWPIKFLPKYEGRYCIKYCSTYDATELVFVMAHPPHQSIRHHHCVMRCFFFEQVPSWFTFTHCIYYEYD